MGDKEFTFDSNEVELDVLKKTINTLQGKLTTFENKKNELTDQMKDLISKTVCAKRDELNNTYTEVLTEAEKRLSSAKAMKAEERKKNIAGLVEKETKTTRQNNGYLNEEIKKVLKDARLPGFINTDYYFSVWSPCNIKQFFVGVLTWLIILFIPTILCFLVYRKNIDSSFPNQTIKIIVITLVYLAFIFIFGLIWLFIDKITKKDKEALSKVKELRKNISDNNKEIDKITKKINKETTDDQFDYTKLDREIEATTIEVENYKKKRQDALTNFANTTEEEIKNKITADGKKAIDDISVEIEKIKVEISNTQKKYDELKLKMCDNKVNGNSI